MGVDLEKVASSFNCSVIDVKELLVNVVVQVSSFIDILEIAVSSSDFSSIDISIDMIIHEINHFELVDILDSVNSLSVSSSNRDIDEVLVSFDKLKSSFNELKLIVS